MLNSFDITPGDVVFAAETLYSDGLIPGFPEGSVLVNEGARGVLINTGHAEEDESQVIFLVRFEDETKQLGPALGCLPSELRAVHDSK